MADIDSILAGVGGNTRADFSGLPKILDSYWAGKDQAAKNDLRDAFKGGVPTLQDGSPDFSTMAKTLFQKGALNEGTAAAQLGINQQNQQFGQGQSRSIQNFESGQPQQPTNYGPPSTNRGAPIPRDAPVRAAPAGQSSAQSQPTVMKILDAQGIPNDQLGAASESLARQLGVNPTDPIDPNDPQVRNVLAPAIAQFKRMNLGQVVPPQQPAPQAPQQPIPQGQPAPVTNAVTTTQAPQTPSRTDQAIAFYSGVMSDPRSPKQNVELAKARLEAVQKNAEFTPLQKEYAQAVLQGFKGTMQDYANEAESGKAGATERAKADVKEQQEYIEGGKAASQRLTTLNAISNVVNGDKSPGMGYAGDTELKVKMALQRMGFDFGDLSGGELMQKMNAALASEMAKSLTARSTQFEFKTFLGNNPGLLLDKTGNQRLIGIFSQLAKREIDLGKLARQNQDNWQNWDKVVEKYDSDKSHQIIDPISKQPIYTDSIVSPGPSKTQATPTLEPGKTVVNGHLYKGGNPKDKNSWELRS